MTFGFWRGLRLYVLVSAVFTLAACAPTYRNSGYVPSEDELAELVVGVDDRSAVEEQVGRPATQGVISDDAWYFVGSRWEYFAYREAKEIDRQVVSISFNDSGTIRNIERFTLQDGEVIALNRRVTDSNIRNVSFIGQILNSIGNFNPGTFLN